MSGDMELERLMARRMRDMERQMLARKAAAETAGNTEKKPKSGPRQILVSTLGYRGVEVLENAERQFPSQMAMLVPRLADMASRGELAGLDGGRLLQILRLVGLPVRMQTSIKVEKDGKFVPLAEKLGAGP